LQLQQFTTRSFSRRFISIGRLLHWKGFALGLRAFAQAALPNDVEYWIIGEGAEQPGLQALAEDLGIASQVKFQSKLPRNEIFQTLGASLALVHPSLHESGGFVCLEAMAAGCPVICLDLGGPGIQVTNETGFKVPPSNPEQAVAGIANAMLRLATDIELRDHLGATGQKRVRELFNWQTRGQFWSQVYNNALSRESHLKSGFTPLS